LVRGGGNLSDELQMKQKSGSSRGIRRPPPTCSDSKMSSQNFTSKSTQDGNFSLCLRIFKLRFLCFSAPSLMAFCSMPSELSPHRATVNRCSCAFTSFAHRARAYVVKRTVPWHCQSRGSLTGLNLFSQQFSPVTSLAIERKFSARSETFQVLRATSQVVTGAALIKTRKNSDG
jgi:hypothetical protein